MLERLQISNFRNFSSAGFDFVPGINLIYGPNGVGKTSILEALFLLTQGKSFRTKDLDHLIYQSADALVVHAMLSQSVRDDLQQQISSMGFTRALKGASERQMNGVRGVKLSEIAHALPLQFVDTNSHRLLAEASQYRRSILNWGVFHFVPQYAELWQRHKQILKQRNACLKLGSDQVGLWTEHLAATARQLCALQQDYLEALQPALQQNWAALFHGELEIDLALYPGWRRDQDIAEVLAQHLASDQRSGYTHYGSHRADLRLSVGGQPAGKFLSQGQLKILLFALKCAQVTLLKQMGGQNSLIMIDDLTAELDGQHQVQLLKYLQGIAPQILLTSASQVTVDSLVGQLEVTAMALGESTPVK